MSHGRRRRAGIPSTTLAIVLLTAAGCGNDYQTQTKTRTDARSAVLGDCQDLMAVRFGRPQDAGASLGKTKNNAMWIRLVGSTTDALPGEIEIRELLPEGAFGEDLSGGFAFALDGMNGLRIHEQGAVLLNRHWYALINRGLWAGVCPFEVHLRVLVGDMDANGFVTAVDVGAVNLSPAGPATAYSRSDINGDGFRTAIDVGLVNASQGVMPPKPSGHDDL